MWASNFFFFRFVITVRFQRYNVKQFRTLITLERLFGNFFFWFQVPGTWAIFVFFKRKWLAITDRQEARAIS